MRIAVGADDPGALVDALRRHLRAAGHEVVEPVSDGSVWVDVGEAVGRAVAEGRAELGVVVCWTGTGVSIAANKVPGVRAALCVDAETAAGARRWNDANVLALSQRLTTAAVGEEVLDAFLAGQPDDDERPTIGRLP
ncbi:MAG: RpiB/LacA/LacB family sugar-phosphate isomerase [Actinomycetota bacterium]